MFQLHYVEMLQHVLTATDRPARGEAAESDIFGTDIPEMQSFAYGAGEHNRTAAATAVAGAAAVPAVAAAAASEGGVGTELYWDAPTLGGLDSDALAR